MVCFYDTDGTGDGMMYKLCFYRCTLGGYLCKAIKLGLYMYLQLCRLQWMHMHTVNKLQKCWMQTMYYLPETMISLVY